jgi:hypothetical protein
MAAMTTAVETCVDQSVLLLNDPCVPILTHHFCMVIRTIIILYKLKVLLGIKHISVNKFGLYVKEENQSSMHF